MTAIMLKFIIKTSESASFIALFTRFTCGLLDWFYIRRELACCSFGGFVI